MKITATFLIMLLLWIPSITIAQLISIETDNTSLVYTVKNNKVYQLYFGEKIENKLGLDNLSVTLDEIYPSFGNGSSNEVALIATHDDGTMATDLSYVSHEQKAGDNNINTVIRLKDKVKDFYVDVHTIAYIKENVFEQWTTIRNQEKKSVTLNQFASSALSFKAASYYLTHFHGSWAKEMMLSEEQLSNGIKNIETQRGVRTTEYENPSFVLALNQKASDHNGEIIMGALAWAGNFKLGFQIEDTELCKFTGGINPFASQYILKPGEEFTTPRMILTYSNSGKNQASINLHRWARNYNLKQGNELRPVVLNSWEGAYFSFDDAKLKSMMDGAAQLGVEVFVLDDGWFGNKYPRNNDKAGLGDWQVNNKKLPKGIVDLIDYAESKGLKFGIWVEPEMVNPASELAEKHPDWIIQRGNNREMLLERNQLLLDLSNPKVQEFVFGVVDDILTQNPRIAYIKWDANRHLQNFGSMYLAKQEQSHLWIEYTKGLESVLERLYNKYPYVIFQDCSSGGGRLDYGTLKYTSEFWASDDTDPYERLFIQWGNNHIYPAIAMGSHVTKSPNHQSGRDTPLKFRFDMAMAGRLGVELSPDDLSSEDLSFIQSGIELYKKIRPIIQFGDLYRLQSPYDADGFASINYITPEKDKAVLLVYSHELHRRDERAIVKLKGLNPDASYRITEINKPQKGRKFEYNEQTFSGSVLMNIGLQINLKRPLSSKAFMLERVE